MKHHVCDLNDFSYFQDFFFSTSIYSRLVPDECNLTVQLSFCTIQYNSANLLLESQLIIAEGIRLQPFRAMQQCPVCLMQKSIV